MNTSLWLRISSIASLLLGVGHTLGGRKSWSPVGENDVLQAMRSVAFDVGGVQRTYLDFYVGFGYTLSAYLFLQAALLWQLAAIAKQAHFRWHDLSDDRCAPWHVTRNSAQPDRGTVQEARRV